MRKYTLKEVVDILTQNEVPVGPVFDIRDILKDPHAREREMVIHAPDEERGSLLMEGVFPRMSLTPGTVRYAGKRIGADNKEVFEERLGLSKEEVEKLSKEKII